MPINSRRKEIWKDIPNYEGYYQVSTLGRVRSCDRIIRRINNGTICDIKLKGKILSQYVNPHNKYCYIVLNKCNKSKTERVHKLVVQAFIDDTYYGYNVNKVIDHIDGNKQNNKLENLEIVSQFENQQRAWKKHKGKNNYFLKKRRKVIDLTTNKIYDSMSDLAKDINVSRVSSITRVCRGERTHIHGHKIKWLDDTKGVV